MPFPKSIRLVTIFWVDKMRINFHQDWRHFEKITARSFICFCFVFWWGVWKKKKGPFIYKTKDPLILKSSHKTKELHNFKKFELLSVFISTRLFHKSWSLNTSAWKVTRVFLFPDFFFPFEINAFFFTSYKEISFKISDK